MLSAIGKQAIFNGTLVAVSWNPRLAIAPLKSAKANDIELQARGYVAYVYSVSRWFSAPKMKSKWNETHVKHLMDPEANPIVHYTLLGMDNYAGQPAFSDLRSGEVWDEEITVAICPTTESDLGREPLRPVNAQLLPAYSDIIVDQNRERTSWTRSYYCPSTPLRTGIYVHENRARGSIAAAQMELKSTGPTPRAKL